MGYFTAVFTKHYEKFWRRALCMYPIDWRPSTRPSRFFPGRRWRRGEGRSRWWPAALAVSWSGSLRRSVKGIGLGRWISFERDKHLYKHKMGNILRTFLVFLIMNRERFEIDSKSRESPKSARFVTKIGAQYPKSTSIQLTQMEISGNKVFSIMHSALRTISTCELVTQFDGVTSLQCGMNQFDQNLTNTWESAAFIWQKD